MAAETRIEPAFAKTYLAHFQEASGEERRRKVTRSFFQALETLDLFARRREMVELRRGIQQSSQKEKLIAALTEYASPYCWEGIFFGSRTQLLASVADAFFAYDNSLHKEISFEPRFQFSGTEKCMALFGSSFATNREERLDHKGHSILDRTIGLDCRNEKGEFTGYALALADGAGGHFGDVTQDFRIGKAAETAVKDLARHLARHADPESLKSDLPSILEMVKFAVQEEGKGEGSTLVGCRAFPEKESFRLIGLNIGDGMLFAYQKDLGFISLLNAHQSEMGTAIFPLAYRSFEIQILDQTVPSGTFLFCLSDGFHDILPYQEETFTYPNGLEYKSRSLDANKMKTLCSLLDEEPKVQDFLHTLIQAALKELNQTRLVSLNQENIQIGDDVSAICCLLDLQKPPGSFSTITEIWNSLWV